MLKTAQNKIKLCSVLPLARFWLDQCGPVASRWLGSDRSWHQTRGRCVLVLWLVSASHSVAPMGSSRAYWHGAASCSCLKNSNGLDLSPLLAGKKNSRLQGACRYRTCCSWVVGAEIKRRRRCCSPEMMKRGGTSLTGVGLYSTGRLLLTRRRRKMRDGALVIFGEISRWRIDGTAAGGKGSHSCCARNLTFKRSSIARLGGKSDVGDERIGYGS
ncbi:TGACG motif-binding factor 6 [Striga asiatica]|uniref:TGACG motif-binding factor 6 n=1 Tax=Striga asiatica TaxID=4170 RepID=A0A5A7QDC9_STRAF|nr:TGACG motif-binding factor 6 [Striga asiatica]